MGFAAVAAFSAKPVAPAAAGGSLRPVATVPLSARLPSQRSRPDGFSSRHRYLLAAATCAAGGERGFLSAALTFLRGVHPCW